MLTKIEILLYSFSFAFFITQVLRTITIFNRRPFNIRLFTLKPFSCIMCMTAWTALILSVGSGLPAIHCFGMMFTGLVIGAGFEVVKMKYL